MNKAESYLKGKTRGIVQKASNVLVAKKAVEKKLQTAGATVRKSAVQLGRSVKKSGIKPMNDKGIIGDVSKVRR